MEEKGLTNLVLVALLKQRYTRAPRLSFPLATIELSVLPSLIWTPFNKLIQRIKYLMVQPLQLQLRPG